MEQIKIKDYVQSWYDAKEKASHFDKLAEKNKQKIISYMIEHSVDTIKTEDYIVSKKESSRESISKVDLPEDIWRKYCKTTSYSTYSIKER